MPVQYGYWRCFTLYAETINTLQEALARAKNDVEYNTANPEKIILENGTVIEHDEILERSGYYSNLDIDGQVVESSIVQPLTDPDRLIESE